MKLPVKIRFILLLLFALPATLCADISGNTQSSGFCRGAWVPWAIYLQSHVEGSIGDVVMSGIEAGAEIGLGDWTGAIGDAVSAFESAGDKVAQAQTSMIVYKDDPCDSFTLQFSVSSDDDPFGIIRASSPQGTPSSVQGVGAKSGGVSVSFTVASLQEGSFFPVLFVAKETDCGECLSILHVVWIEIARHCQPNSECERLLNLLQQTNDRISTLLRQKREVASLDPQIAEALKALRAFNECANVMKKGVKTSQACEQSLRLDQLQGSCPDIALGAHPATCTQLRALQTQIADLTRQRDVTAKTLQSKIYTKYSTQPKRR